MRTDLFDFDLPADRIALRPASPRDAARLLVVQPGRRRSWKTGTSAICRTCCGRAIAWWSTTAKSLRPGSRAGGSGGARPSPRSRRPCTSASTARTGALSSSGPRRCRSAIRCGSAPRARSVSSGELDAQVSQKDEGGEVTLSFSFHGPVLDQAIAERGAMPLPPYIASRREPDEQDRSDYQTVFARAGGLGGGADRRPAFHRKAAGAAEASAGSPFTKSPCMWAPAPSCR